MGEVDKVTRIIMILLNLTKGKAVNKFMISQEYEISERTVERDIEFIRNFICGMYRECEILYSRETNSYYMTNISNESLSSVEVVNLLKLILDSRAFRLDEMSGLVNSVIECVDKNSRREIKELAARELTSYVEPKHNKALMKLHWDLNICIKNRKKIKIKYHKAYKEIVERIISPINIVFYDRYFYLIAYRDGESYRYPAFLRIDRIESFTILDEKYDEVLYARFNMVEFKNSIKFMYGGELINTKIKIKNVLKATILDQMPNSKIVSEDEEFTYLTTRVFEDGFIKWVLSYGTSVEVMEPAELRFKIKNELMKIVSLY